MQLEKNIFLNSQVISKRSNYLNSDTLYRCAGVVSHSFVKQVADGGAHVAQQFGDTSGQKKRPRLTASHIDLLNSNYVEYTECLGNNNFELLEDKIGKEYNPRQMLRTTKGFER